MQTKNTEQNIKEKIIDVERSIIKKYRKEIWSKFIQAIKNYEMVTEGDKICVCVSGGKDSMLLAKLFQELQRHGKVNFEIKFMLMDPGYDKQNLDIVFKNAQNLGIPLERFESHIFEIVKQVDNNPCYLCARMRRGHLYNGARILGCNKIALGHHGDDVIETIMLNLCYGSEIKTMMPKVKSQNFNGMELIRPLYYILEQDIIAWKNYNNLNFINCACPLNDACDIAGQDPSMEWVQGILLGQILGKKPSVNKIGKRTEMKNLLKIINTINPEIKQNIFKSLDNVNLDTVTGYRKNGERFNFLDIYKDSRTEE
ncbi:MAG: tRNA 2-thiocytidine biosynthesis protein TtcA [Defluviitaleaceae bacterium]|nr:tRNA 2-thiocytidine biosynthesis protein TtcA [Defluviitaleaceae bacterium]